MSNPESLDYDPAFEWPGAEVCNRNTGQPATIPSRRTSLRLVVQSSDVLSKRRKIAILDAYDEVQIGRDASSDESVPRIRLKDMEVSKLHATIFWDHERDGWAIVDMASKHGTFIKPKLVPSHPQLQTSSGSSNSAGAFVRLSPPKQASMPRTLHHADCLAIGRSVFQVHLHHNGIPCEDCTSVETYDIPLFATNTRPTKDPEPSEGAPASPARAHDSKMAISLLKKSLLSRHSSDASKESDGATVGHPSKYTDRSAKRRALHPYSHADSAPGASLRHAPGSETGPLLPTFRHSPSRRPFMISSVPSDHVVSSSASLNSGTPPPISDSNIGHKLLAKQGWAPGTSLGLNSSSENDVNEKRLAIVEPIQATANIGRLGLGMRTSVDTSKQITLSYGDDWKEEMKRRRWRELHNLG